MKNLLILFLFSNSLHSMQINKIEDSLILNLPDEILIHIINITTIEDINNWKDIFQDYKIDLNNISGLLLTYKRFNCLFKDGLLFLNKFKEKKFNELFYCLKNNSLKEYKDFSIKSLDSILFKILNKVQVSTKDFKKAIRLILAGADINSRNNSELTILIRFSKLGSKELLKILIKAGVSVNNKINNGWNVLMWVTKKEIAEILIKAGADVNAKNNYGWTPLIIAAERGNKEVVKVFIEAGANVSAKDNDGFNALMWAAFIGHKDIVEMLINAGADINVKNNAGNTALMLAAHEGYKNIIDILKS